MSEKYDRHGGPYDRGDADAYYGRPGKPHYFVGASHTSELVEQEQMTEQQIAEYWRGYEENRSGSKSWR